MHSLPPASTCSCASHCSSACISALSVYVLTPSSPKPPLKKQESLRTIPNASINSEKWISAAAPTKTERKAVNEKYSKANELPTVSVSEVTAEMCFSLTLPRVVYLSQRSGLILCCV
eukprot:GHVU01179137.1.p2 GENE.GHVU01179137.1~~GHVU01179137.1.p2  ORF type:complete len:117 (-),score=2.16 GHVU01179137.1:165-515(-)